MTVKKLYVEVIAAAVDKHPPDIMRQQWEQWRFAFQFVVLIYFGKQEESLQTEQTFGVLACLGMVAASRVRDWVSQSCSRQKFLFFLSLLPIYHKSLMNLSLKSKRIHLIF